MLYITEKYYFVKTFVINVYSYNKYVCHLLLYVSAINNNHITENV